MKTLNLATTADKDAQVTQYYYMHPRFNTPERCDKAKAELAVIVDKVYCEPLDAVERRQYDKIYAAMTNTTAA